MENDLDIVKIEVYRKDRKELKQMAVQRDKTMPELVNKLLTNLKK